MKLIENEDRARQLMLFNGMARRWDLSPTNIDLFQEYCGKLFIYGEGKLRGKDSLKGQKTAFEHICESHYEPEFEKTPWLSKHFVWVLMYEHDTPSNQDVMVKDQYVVNVYSSINPEWRTPKSDEVIPKFILDSNGNITVLNAIIQIENWCYKYNIPIGK